MRNVKKQFTPSELAKIRFPDEYLELLTDENSNFSIESKYLKKPTKLCFSFTKVKTDSNPNKNILLPNTIVLCSNICLVSSKSL